MKEQPKYVWVKVEYVQYEEVPVKANSFDEAVSVLQKRNPDSRLSPAHRSKWQYSPIDNK